MGMKELTEIDIIIISYAYDNKKRELTDSTIKSLLSSESEDEFTFHIFVIESEKTAENYNYRNTITIKPSETFGYHRYLNIGISMGSSPWLVLANNDLIFKKGWASAILGAIKIDPELESFGTWCERFHPSKGISKTPTIQYGYINGIHVTGWSIILTRKLYIKMNGLDEKFKFWYCDDDYKMTIKQMGVKHALITNAEITHLTSQTTIELDDKKYMKMTLLPNLYFDYKWNHRSYIIYMAKLIILWLKNKLK